MRATMVVIPHGIGLGDPPLRLADAVYVSAEPGADPERAPVFTLASGLPELPARVFDTLADFLLALRFMHDGARVPRALFDTWRKRGCEVDASPCLECRNLHRAGDDACAPSRRRGG